MCTVMRPAIHRLSPRVLIMQEGLDGGSVAGVEPMADVDGAARMAAGVRSRGARVAGGGLRDPERVSDVFAMQRQVVAAVRVGAMFPGLLRSAGMWALPDVWVRVGISKAGAEVYFVFGQRVRALTGARMRQFWTSMAAAAVWRVDVGVGWQRPAPVDVCVWVPRLIGAAGRRPRTHLAARARAGICFQHMGRQPYVGRNDLEMRLSVRWSPDLRVCTTEHLRMGFPTPTSPPLHNRAQSQ